MTEPTPWWTHVAPAYVPEQRGLPPAHRRWPWFIAAVAGVVVFRVVAVWWGYLGSPPCRRSAVVPGRG